MVVRFGTVENPGNKSHNLILGVFRTKQEKNMSKQIRILLNLRESRKLQKKNIIMGKGDKKSRRGKIILGTFGVRRPRKKADKGSKAGVPAEKEIKGKKKKEAPVAKETKPIKPVKEETEPVVKEVKAEKEKKQAAPPKQPREKKEAKPKK